MNNYAVIYSFKCMLVALALTLVGCTSSGPATSFYTLFPANNSIALETKADLQPLGVALVRLPGYLDNDAIVSLTDSQKINVSGYHAWAEPLDEAATRVISSNLRSMLKHDKVSEFPWDMRIRPDLQLRIQLAQFDGERGGNVTLSSSWVLYSVSEKRVMTSGRFEQNVNLDGDSYDAYVRGLNELLNALSADLANTIYRTAQ